MEIYRLMYDKQLEIPISKIGSIQLKDVQNSTGLKHYNEYYRLCEVIKEPKAFDNRGDCSPYRMADLFGGNWIDYNFHFIVQVAGCPLRCPYCYVDNMKVDQQITAFQLVQDFIQFRKAVLMKYEINLQVFHLMGGDPGLYAFIWPQLRSLLDELGQQDVILFSDVVFVENHKTGIKPWKYLDIKRFLLTGCLKGVNPENFHKNTGLSWFNIAIKELEYYVDAPNFYLCLIENDKNIELIKNIIDPSKIDYLQVINYEVTKQRTL